LVVTVGWLVVVDLRYRLPTVTVTVTVGWVGFIYGWLLPLTVTVGYCFGCCPVTVGLLLVVGYVGLRLVAVGSVGSVDSGFQFSSVG